MAKTVYFPNSSSSQGYHITCSSLISFVYPGKVYASHRWEIGQIVKISVEVSKIVPHIQENSIAGKVMKIFKAKLALGASGLPVHLLTNLFGQKPIDLFLKDK